MVQGSAASSRSDDCARTTFAASAYHGRQRGLCCHADPRSAPIPHLGTQMALVCTVVGKDPAAIGAARWRKRQVTGPGSRRRQDGEAIGHFPVSLDPWILVVLDSWIPTSDLLITGFGWAPVQSEEARCDAMRCACCDPGALAATRSQNPGTTDAFALQVLASARTARSCSCGKQNSNSL